ncbi:DUF4403 family protein [Deinococcus sp.]|uniref:DUF4403 family protein n=1 Tax=Deinococcus sp. TaxID=47478 RepID=UPI003CC636FD
MILTVTHPAAALPAPALSSLSLPVSLPLSSLRAAALARVPDVLATVAQQQTFAGGLLTVHLTGEVRRSGDLTLTPDGDGLRLSLPISATFRAAPVGLGDFLARDFKGAAVITAHVTPVISEDWNAGVKVQADYRWTDPLSFELMKGVTIQVQSLVDPQLRSRLQGISDNLNASARTGLNLRERATQLWAQLAQPWTLPGVAGGYALVHPQGLTVTPISFTQEAAQLTLGGSFVASASLGERPAAALATSLPPLKIGVPQSRGVQLALPVSLAYPQLSALATQYAARQDYPLPLPFGPRLHIQAVTLSSPGAGQLSAAVNLSLHGPLGLNVSATVDVSGTPHLEGTVLTLEHVAVKTRPEGVSGRVLGWLADSRVQSLLGKQARFDLGPALEVARASIQARLPYTAAPGVVLSGTVERLELRSVSVDPAGVLALAGVGGSLTARVELK